MANISQNWLDKGLLDVLSVFTYKYEQKKYSKQIARELNLPNRTVSRKLDNASRQGLIKYVREGKNKLYYLDLNSKKTFQIIVMLESYKALKFAVKNPNLFMLLEKHEPKLIFGSYAEFKDGKDLDVVFFSTEEPDNDLIHAQLTNKKEFRKLLLKKETLLVEIANKHIILSDYDYFVSLFLEFYKG